MNQNVGKSALKSHLRKFFGRIICNAIFVTFLSPLLFVLFAKTPPLMM